jgi:hypothetical protein
LATKLPVAPGDAGQQESDKTESDEKGLTETQPQTVVAPGDAGQHDGACHLLKLALNAYRSQSKSKFYERQDLEARSVRDSLKAFVQAFTFPRVISTRNKTNTERPPQNSSLCICGKFGIGKGAMVESCCKEQVDSRKRKKNDSRFCRTLCVIDPFEMCGVDLEKAALKAICVASNINGCPDDAKDMKAKLKKYKKSVVLVVKNIDVFTKSPHENYNGFVNTLIRWAADEEFPLCLIATSDIDGAIGVSSMHVGLRVPLQSPHLCLSV